MELEEEIYISIDTQHTLRRFVIEVKHWNEGS
jgi:hypothetical protein